MDVDCTDSNGLDIVLVTSTELIELEDPLDNEVVKNVLATLRKRVVVPVEVVPGVSEVSCIVFFEYGETSVAVEDLAGIDDCACIFAVTVLSTNKVDTFVVPFEVLANCPDVEEETAETEFE